MKRHLKLAAVAGATMLALSACSGGTTAQNDGSEGKPIRVAFLAASAQNGYNQSVYQGVQEGAKELGLEITTSIMDGQFDSNTQLGQLQNATSSGQYDAVIVVPQDGPSLVAAFPTANQVPVVSVLNPIGPDINKMEPQVEGVVSTVAAPPSEGAAKQAEYVVKYCKDKNPCEVALLVGLLNSPLDVAREKAYRDTLSKESNIKIVGTYEGAYDRDKSLTAVTNLLQSNPNVDAILSNADQQTLGAQIAIENAGKKASSIYLTGGGGTEEAVTALRKGDWGMCYLNFTVSMGKAALQEAVNAVQGKPVNAVVNSDNLGDGVPAFATKEDLDKHPDFKGQWKG